MTPTYLHKDAMNRSRLLIASTLCTYALISGCATPRAPASVADTLAATPELSTAARLVSEAGLTETLRGPGPFTVFAPTNAAFDAVPAAMRASLAQDKDRLKVVLLYHVVPGQTASADVKTGPVKSAQGANLALSRSGTFVTVDDAVVTSADLRATNGVVHIVDRVLTPPR